MDLLRTEINKLTQNVSCMRSMLQVNILESPGELLSLAEPAHLSSYSPIPSTLTLWEDRASPREWVFKQSEGREQTRPASVDHGGVGLRLAGSF